MNKLNSRTPTPISHALPSYLRLALLLFSLANLTAQSRAQQPQPEGRIIQGTVLSATTGQPLGNASVSISGVDDRTSLAEIITGNDGKFSFAHLQDGKYSLRASHRGFIAAAFDEHPTGSTAVVTGPGLISTGLQFKLQPQAALYGVITEDSGDPVPQARVALYRVTGESAQNGGTPGRSQQASTEEDGSFEISNLAPGKYYIAVSGRPWYAGQGQSVFNVNRSNEPAGHPHSPLDVAYPVTYYPDATDSAYASPIELAGGERVPVNLTLHAVPSIHVTMQFQSSGSNPAPMPQIRQSVFGFPDFVQANMSLTTPDAKRNESAVTTVELSGFAPGQYDLAIVGANGEAAREMQANLSSDQSLDPSSAVSLAQITGKVTRLGQNVAQNAIQEATPSPQQPGSNGDDEPNINFQIELIAQQGQNQYSAPVAKNGAFRLAEVQPGAYDVSVFEGNQALAIAQLSATGATLDGHQIKVSSEPVTLTAKVVDTTATIHGFAKLGGKAIGGIFLELIPMGASSSSSPTLLTRSSALQTNQSDSDGSFDFPKVMPGNYTLLAIQEGWTLDIYNPDSMRPYLAQGLKVTVPLHSRDIVLKDAVDVQPKDVQPK